jgi:hypothetical protein
MTACWFQGCGFAIRRDLGKGLVFQPMNFLLQVQIQAGAAEEAIHLQQARLIGNQLGRAAVGHGAGKQHLRRPVEGVHVAQAIQGLLQAAGANMRHAGLIAGDVELTPGVLDAQGFHRQFN